MKVAEETGDQELVWALNGLPRPITRRSIIDLCHEDPGIRRRRVAIASLMWGYGIAGARWGDSWVTDVSDLLGPSLDDILAKCEASLTAGAIAEAYGLFTRPGPRGREQEKYHGVGFPLITKIVYFVARNSCKETPAEYPLILDTKVSMALAQLTGYRLLARPGDYRPRPDSETSKPQCCHICGSSDSSWAASSSELMPACWFFSQGRRLCCPRGAWCSARRRSTSAGSACTTISLMSGCR